MSLTGEKLFSLSRSKYHIGIICILLIFLAVIENNKTAFIQQQIDPQSAVNSICKIVQDNSLIAGLVGLDQAVNICNNVQSIGSNQALFELCNVVSGLKIINVDSYCNTPTQQADQKIQVQLENGTNSNDNQDANKSGSIIDRLIGFLLNQFGL